jgi:hypothetical protein
MAELVANCPRCSAKSITVNVPTFNSLDTDRLSVIRCNKTGCQ